LGKVDSRSIAGCDITVSGDNFYGLSKVLEYSVSGVINTIVTFFGKFMRRTALLILTGLLAACSGMSGSDTELVAPPVVAEGQIYRIGAGDVLTVSVWGSPELSMSVPVRPDGYISMPLIGDVLASDLEAETLAAAISLALESQLRDPQVTIIVAQVNSVQYTQRVRVTGAVSAPRSLPYARGMSVLDAILEAGGVNELASANRAKLYRATEGRLMEYDIRLDDILLRGELGTNYQMQPGDVITVPERLF
jgi:polysaccharide export outer membrane protein